MKKILINILIFFSVFVVIDKVSALPLGTNYDNFSDEKEEAARFYTTQTSTAFYSISGTTSLVTDDVYVGGNNTSIRFNSNIAIENGMTYKVVIKYVLSNVDNLDIQYHWQIDYANYEVKSFYSYCVAKECIIEYTFTSLEDSNYVWVQGNANSNYTYTFSEFNSAVSYLYKAKVTEVTGEEEEEDTTEDTVYFDTSHENFTSVYDELKPKLEEIKSVLSDNPYNYNYVVYFGVNDYDVKEIVVGLFPSDLEYGINNDFHCTYSATSYYYKGQLYNLDGDCHSKTNRAFLTYKYYSSEKLGYSYDSLIAQLKHDIKVDPTNASASSYSGSFAAGTHLSEHYSSSDAFNFKNNKANYFENHTIFIMPYISSIELYNYYYRPDSTIKSYAIQIDDFRVSVGHYLSASDSYFSNKNYELNFNTTNYKGIKIKFDQESFPEICQEVDEPSLDYETSALKCGPDIDIDLNVEIYNVSVSSLPIPYLNTTYKSTGDVVEWSTDKDLLAEDISNSYKIKKTLEFKELVLSAYIYISFDMVGYYDGYLRFNASEPFEVELIPRDTDEEGNLTTTYKEIDVTGKFGVGFIPKVKDGANSASSYDNVSRFKVKDGGFRYYLYDNYEYYGNKDHLLDSKVVLKEEVFDFKFTRDKLYYYLFFRNTLFDEVKLKQKNSQKSIIAYDSASFNYCILETSISTCEIINPNTSEEVSISAKLNDTDSSITNVFGSFSDFTKSTNFILTNVTTIYNKYLPKDVRVYFYIVFSFTIFIIVLKIIF